MALPILDHHVELGRTVDLFLTRSEALKEARASLDDGPRLPPYWSDFVGMGWLGLHIPESLGGSGFGLFEAAVVSEQLGRHCAGGPFLPVAVLAGVCAEASSDFQREHYVPSLLEGSTIVGLATRGSAVAEGGRMNGRMTALVGADQVDLVAVFSGSDLLLLQPTDPGVSIRARSNLDPSRACIEVMMSDVTVPSERVLRGVAEQARALFHVLASAEAVGGISACRESAVDYSKNRLAFGRPIGQFQGVKHHCASMYVDERLAEAACWEAAQSSDRAAAKAAASVAVSAFERCAKMSLQVHGGLGFTWEHDAHLYLRRAASLSAVVGANGELQTELAAMVHGSNPTVALDRSELSFADTPDLAEVRGNARAFARHYHELDPALRLDSLIASGYMYPHWPTPWGKGFTLPQAAVVNEALADLDRFRQLGPSGWAVPIILPTIIVHGSDDQRRRWVVPSLRGDISWCQLFSEPGAGSDLAGVSTKAERASGGWLLSGQKVWTSNAHDADKGFALVRTDVLAPKHRGLSCMIIDMRTAGVTIVPLRQATGATDFNEVFLDEVYVPDSDVVGEINAGWSVVRTALEYERASLGGFQSSDHQPVTVTAMTTQLRSMARDHWDYIVSAVRGGTASCIEETGELFAEDYAIRSLNDRIAAQLIQGDDVGVDANITKLATGHHVQRAADIAMRLAGSHGVFSDDDVSAVGLMFLQSRMMTIAGGTSEILLNVIAERALGLPRDP